MASTLYRKDVVCLEETDPELLRAWHTFSDPVGAHPVTGEVWQYLGTEHDETLGWRHCFRHRHHPLSHQREYRWVCASPTWVPQDDKG